VLIILLGSIIGFAMAHEMALVNEREQGDTVVRIAVNEDYQEDKIVNVEPLSVKKFKNVVRQAYDYSCGSAALTTLLDFYLGRNFQERQVMEGLLRFGETERIVERRGFSMLDMKRLVTALGHPSGGFKAEASDLETLDHPAIAPIEYAGFKHFVVIRTVYDGRVYVADPALGNISFTLARFLEVWDNNVLFIVFPNGHKPASGLELHEEDMRFVSDYIIAENTFKEFPIFQIRSEHQLQNAIYSSFNNAEYSYGLKVDANGDAVVDDNGNYVFESEVKTADDGGDPDNFNIFIPDDTVGANGVNKSLRYRRK